MGAHTCQYGTVHKRCRCREEHKIACPTPEECAAKDYQPKHRAEAEEEGS